MSEKDKILPEDLKQFPEFSTYISELNILKNYDFENHTVREIYDIFYDYARILPANIGWFSPEKFNSHRFYRVRKNIDRENEDISIAQTYSFPPSNYCLENGRANLKGRTVFYCSDNPIGAIIESKLKAGDEGYLTIWRGVATRRIKIGQLLPYDLPKENFWSLMAKDCFDYFHKDLPNETKNKFKHFVELYKFIAEKFNTEHKPYHLSSMISEELLYGQLWRDFLIYPSKLSDNKLCNMAFHPNSVNENLRFEKVIEFKVENFENDILEYKLGKKVGVIENNQIIWRKRTLEETKLFNGRKAKR